MTYPAEPIELRRKRLLWRSHHRGIKEMDLLMGGFARARLPTMIESELRAFEEIIELPDQELLSWVTGEAPVPSNLNNVLLPELLKFRP
jgi:antitoxin CptB